jgi:hypothetical protein
MTGDGSYQKLVDDIEEETRKDQAGDVTNDPENINCTVPCAYA